MSVNFLQQSKKTESDDAREKYSDDILLTNPEKERPHPPIKFILEKKLVKKDGWWKKLSQKFRKKDHLSVNKVSPVAPITLAKINDEEIKLSAPKSVLPPVIASQTVTPNLLSSVNHNSVPAASSISQPQSVRPMVTAEVKPPVKQVPSKHFWRWPHADKKNIHSIISDSRLNLAPAKVSPSDSWRSNIIAPNLKNISEVKKSKDLKPEIKEIKPENVGHKDTSTNLHLPVNKEEPRRGVAVDLVASQSRTEVKDTPFFRYSIVVSGVILALAVILGAYGYIFWQSRLLQKNINENNAKIATKNETVAKIIADLKNISTTGNQLVGINYLLNQRFPWSDFFIFIEQNTAANIQYTDFGVDEKGVATLSVVAPSYEEAARQIKVFGENPEWITNVTLNKVSLTFAPKTPTDAGGMRVVFDVNLLLAKWPVLK